MTMSSRERFYRPIDLAAKVAFCIPSKGVNAREE
jgi:hypothetical protein